MPPLPFAPLRRLPGLAVCCTLLFQVGTTEAAGAHRMVALVGASAGSRHVAAVQQRQRSQAAHAQAVRDQARRQNQQREARAAQDTRRASQTADTQKRQQESDAIRAYQLKQIQAQQAGQAREEAQRQARLAESRRQAEAVAARRRADAAAETQHREAAAATSRHQSSVSQERQRQAYLRELQRRIRLRAAHCPGGGHDHYLMGERLSLRHDLVSCVNVYYTETCAGSQVYGVIPNLGAQGSNCLARHRVRADPSCHPGRARVVVTNVSACGRG